VCVAQPRPCAGRGQRGGDVLESPAITVSAVNARSDHRGAHREARDQLVHLKLTEQAVALTRGAPAEWTWAAYTGQLRRFETWGVSDGGAGATRRPTHRGSPI
jgi:hypothetical protein